MDVRDRFVDGMSLAASTVNIVTTDGHQGRAGVTVSAMCSVSADPPSLLVCVHHQSTTSDIIKDYGFLCVNVLRDDQAYISDTFSGRIPPPGEDKFSCANWTAGASGSPMLDEALAAFDCRVKMFFQSGSHYIFVADVLEISSAAAGHPLIYANRAYGTPLKLDQFPVLTSARGDASRTLDIGCFVTLGPFFMPQLIRGFLSGSASTDIRVHEGVQDQLAQGLEQGHFELALLYDVNLSSHFETTLVGEVAPHVLLAEKHPLANHAEFSLHDLAKEPMVLLDIPPSRDYFSSLFGEVSLKPRIQYHSPSFEMVRGMVGNGLGYAILITKPANNMSYDGKALVTRSLKETVTPGRIVMAQLAGKILSESASAFKEHSAAFFANFKSDIPT